MQKTPSKRIIRPPVIVIMGHIDHGKSTLLDYIRKTDVVEAETGGITQHLSAYEVRHRDEKGIERKITFLDTPGHEAFQKIRTRGAAVADIAILIVSAEDGVKEQTLEALSSIKEAKLPYIVAISKIDKPNANLERTKQNLGENEVYLEGLGGDVPWVAISSKEGTGIPELLDLMLLVADIEELSGDPQKNAEGVVIEASLDSRKGISATLVIRDGSIKSGMSVVSGDSISPVRILEDFQGKPIKSATFSSPVRLVGWNTLPEVGSPFLSFNKKKEAEKFIAKEKKENQCPIETNTGEKEERFILNLILKADAVGSLEAIRHEILKIPDDRVLIKIIQHGVGTISENDIKVASSTEGTLLIGFHTKISPAVNNLADRNGVEIHIFDIIYKLSEWLTEVVKKRTPKEDITSVTARAKILKLFSHTKNRHVVGGRVENGSLSSKKTFRIIRQETEVGTGKIFNLQQQKADTQEVREGNEFGAQLDSEIDIAPGDYIETCITERK